MTDEFYCGACGKWKPLHEKVDRLGRRPKCNFCERRAIKLDAAARQQKDGLRRPATKLNAAFLRWVSNV